MDESDILMAMESGQEVCSLHQVIYQSEGDEIHLEEEAIEFMKDEAIPNTLAVFKSKVAELAEEDFKQDQIFACIKATQKEAKARGIQKSFSMFRSRLSKIWSNSKSYRFIR